MLRVHTHGRTRALPAGPTCLPQTAWGFLVDLVEDGVGAAHAGALFGVLGAGVEEG